MQTKTQPLVETTGSGSFSYRPRPGYELAKRLTEMGIALLILVGLSPVWLAVALAIRFTSPGPILFKGRVVGRNGREFTYYKFRSMRHNSDNTAHRQFIADYVRRDLGHAVGGVSEPAPKAKTLEATHEAPKAATKLTNDRRVTGIGKLIRKLSIDEVPQLLNVVKGDMAIVGPRPPVPYEYSMYNDWAKQRLNVLPGITGLAQIRMRGTASFRQMVETDLEYIENRSYKLDWQIIVQTPLAMLKGA